MNKNTIKKTIECPICKKITMQQGLKSSVLKVLHQDIDLYIEYEGVEPLYYGVYFCNHCGYANLTQNFLNPKERKFVYNGLFADKWVQNQIPKNHSLEYAIRLYKLVLLNKTSLTKTLHGEVGIVCLKLYYLYKLQNNEKEMIRFRRFALENLIKGYESESFPFGGVYTDHMVSYLIAIFSFYEGDEDTCKQWLSNLIKDHSTPSRLKEKARDFKDENLSSTN